MGRRAPTPKYMWQMGGPIEKESCHLDFCVAVSPHRSDDPTNDHRRTNQGTKEDESQRGERGGEEEEEEEEERGGRKDWLERIGKMNNGRKSG